MNLFLKRDTSDNNAANIPEYSDLQSSSIMETN